MQTFNSRCSLIALSAIGFALLPLAGAAQAKTKYKGGSSDFPPAYGRRDKERKKDRKGDRVRYDDYGQTVTLEGIVTSADAFDNNGTTRFRVQAGGRSFDVTSDSSVRVRQGQRVTLRGAFDDDDNFDARTVTIAGRANDNRGDNDPYGNDYRPGIDRRVEFPAVVTRVFKSGHLEVRADNGRTYVAEPRSGSGEFQVGNRIRVSGTANGNRVENARVTFQNGGVVGPILGGNGNGGFENGKSVNFYGRIVSINISRLTAVVRGDNGRDYTVRGDEVKKGRQGDRVWVRGIARYGTIELTDLDRK